ncbi:TIGR00266 family protein [Halobacteriovorax sp. GB3]|uniref:TIGR00266 family protein n=1 Tax=Halobacteriovorax sp. GB3 TaxID=2719615 RepID=UPI002361EDA6|nr:TIGR00266 family protein [Halobacteriovorax sp. GB3]MDD0851835.1 TIGR00266 family protein [Halobacteriovorax sp. GB3]
MNVQKEGGSSFSFLRIKLAKGEKLTTESGAMASMDKDIELRSRLNGGFLQGLIMKFLGKESLFINTFQNKSKVEKEVVLTQATPGDIREVVLDNEELFIQPGSYLASTSGIKFSLRWAGFSSWIAGEGLFRIRISGSGTCWYGAYGAVIEKEIDGEYIVDTGHLLSYPSTIKLKIMLPGGVFSSFFGGEGFVLRLEGKGTVKLQTRSIEGLASWLNPRFWN